MDCGYAKEVFQDNLETQNNDNAQRDTGFSSNPNIKFYN